jgi:hypothetical protein
MRRLWFLLVGLVIQVASANNLAHLEALLEQREKSLRSLYYKYTANYTIHREKKVSYEGLVGKPYTGGRFSFEVFRGQEITRVRFYPSDYKIVERGTTHIRVGKEYPIAEWEWWFGGDWAGLHTFALGDRFSILSEGLYLFTTPESGFYYFIPVPPQEYPLTHVDTTLLANANPLKVAGTRWEKVKFDSGRWSLKGGYPARFAEGVIQIELDAKGTPLYIKATEQRGDQVILDMEWQCLEFTEVNGHKVPLRTLRRWKRPSLRVEETSEILLLQNLPMDKDIEMNLAVGTSVLDVRLKPYDKLLQSSDPMDEAVQYLWKGRLLSKDELKQLAYQQGHLLPPETPRQRYSLWLFLPSVLFFIAAAYLYWRQRRR